MKKITFITLFLLCIVSTFAQRNINKYPIELLRDKSFVDENGRKIDIELIYTKVQTGEFFLMPNNKLDTQNYIIYKKNSKKLIKRIIQDINKNDSILKSKIGKKYPDFSFMDIEGKEHKLSDYKNKIVVLNFWFISCSPCRKEIPYLNELVEKYKDKEIVFIAFPTDKKEQLVDFLKNNPFNYLQIPNSIENNNKQNILSYPTNLIINKDGVLIFQGHGNKDDIDKMIETINGSIITPK